MNSHAENIVISADKVKFYKNFYGWWGLCRPPPSRILLYIRGRSILGIDFVKWFASPPCHSSVIALVFWFIKLPMHDFLNMFFTCTHVCVCIRHVCILYATNVYTCKYLCYIYWFTYHMSIDTSQDSWEFLPKPRWAVWAAQAFAAVQTTSSLAGGLHGQRGIFCGVHHGCYPLVMSK